MIKLMFAFASLLANHNTLFLFLFILFNVIEGEVSTSDDYLAKIYNLRFVLLLYYFGILLCFEINLKMLR